MTMRQLAMAVLIQVVAGAPFGSGAFAQGPLSAPSASEIDGKVTAAHTKRGLYRRGPIWLRRSTQRSKNIGLLPHQRRIVWLSGRREEVCIRIVLHDRLISGLPR